MPPGTTGIIVVLENSCNQTYTYEVDGTEASFLGHGDLHDTHYDYLEAVTEFPAANVSARALPGANCQYRLRVYPSREFENEHTTDRPLMYVIMLAAVFVFTSAVFLLYDCMVERRQKKVMKSARQSSALVSSLFPEAVRDRLYQEQKEENNTAEKKREWKAPSGASQDELCKSKGATTAIANLYPECTVLFADIAGFTKWSSSRSPIEVFDLLETIYEAFDKNAKRRGVFKVETIGDVSRMFAVCFRFALL